MVTKLRHSIGKREEKGQGVAVVSQAPFCSGPLALSFTGV